MSQLSINTKRLHISNLLPEQLDEFYQYRSNPEVTRYQGFNVMTLEEAAQFISDNSDKRMSPPGEWVQFGMKVVSSGALVGDCAIRIREDEPQTAEVGITVSHQFQRMGFASEALKGLLDFLFGKYQMRRVVMITDTRNKPAVRLLKSAGLRPEGYFISNTYFKGHWSSEYHYALLKTEWEKLRADIVQGANFN